MIGGRGPLTISKRLAALANAVPPCHMVADIGCDHGYLSVYLAQTGRCERVLACDISPFSVEKTRRQVQENGVDERVDVMQCDGLSAAQKADAAVLAGIGGNELLRIVADAAPGPVLVLQPASHAAELRRGLCLLGYKIEWEAVVCDGRLYPLIRAVYTGQKTELDELQAEIGPYNLRHPDDTVLLYAKWRRNILLKACAKEPRSERGRSMHTAYKVLTERIEQWLEEHDGNS